MQRLIRLALIGGLATGTAQAATPGGPNWIVDPAKGCGTSNPFPNPDDRIEWSGACRNGLLHGPGTLIWRQGSIEYERDEGSFRDGELEGPAVIRFPDGRAIHGSYTGGQRDGPFTVVMPDGTYIRATYHDGELAGEYRMSDREVAAWKAAQAAAPPPAPVRQVTTVTGTGDGVRTTVAAAPAGPAAPAVDTGRPPRLGESRPAVAAAPPALPAPRVAAAPVPPPTPAAPATAVAPPPPPPSPPAAPPVPSILPGPSPMRERPPAPSIVQRRETPSIVASAPPPPAASAPVASTPAFRTPPPSLPPTSLPPTSLPQVAPPARAAAVAPSIRPPIRPLPPTTPPLPAAASAPLVLPAPAPPPPAASVPAPQYAYAQRPVAAARVGAIPIFGTGAPALLRPAETVVIGSDGRPLPPLPGAAPAAGGGIRLRPPGTVVADDLPPGEFSIDLRGASVQDAAAAVFGALLGRPYTVAPGLAVPITLAPSRPVAAAELLASFRQQLNAAGADLRRTPAGYAIERY